jgi:hypothetical protein
MKRGKDKEMFAHVERWKESGMSIGTYAKTIGFSNGKLEYWARKLKVVDATNNNNIEFVELPSMAEDIEITNKTPKSLPHPQIVLTFPSGMRVNIYG